MTAIEEYNNLIQNGTIRACKKLKTVYTHIVENMHNESLQYKYDESKAKRAVDFIETFCCIPKMRGAPKFKLELWQKAMVETIFGFVDKETGYRQYREAFLYVGRKNAKSVLGAAMALYMLIADSEDAPEIYSAATG